MVDLHGLYQKSLTNLIGLSILTGRRVLFIAIGELRNFAGGVDQKVKKVLGRLPSNNFEQAEYSFFYKVTDMIKGIK